MKRRRAAGGASRRRRGGLDWVKRRPGKTVTVLVADPERATRNACVRVVQSIRGMRVVGEAQTGLEAVSATARLKPRVVLLDLKLSSEFGATLIAILRRKSPRSRVILLAGRASESRILDALSHGAVGAISKKDVTPFLPAALEAVAAGEAWMSRRLIPKILDRLAGYRARVEMHR